MHTPRLVCNNTF